MSVKSDRYGCGRAAETRSQTFKEKEKMTAEEMRNEFNSLYNLMANSNKVEFMHIFGMVHKQMFDWFLTNNPELAMQWLEKLEAIKWKQYLSPKEAEEIVSRMEPKAPWSREQWKQAMEQHGFELEKEPCYNKCALWAVMNMEMSDSSQTLSKYIGGDELFNAVHDLAVDKLTDKDGNFNVRKHWNL